MVEQAERTFERTPEPVFFTNLQPLMLRIVYFPAVLLHCLTYLSCTTPSEHSTQNLQDQPNHTIVSKALPPDTAGLYQAFRQYSEQNDWSLPPSQSQWRLLTMTGADSGMIPMSTYFDDSTGFDALFFRRTNGVFRFYFVSSLSADGVVVPALPDAEASMETYGGR